MSTNLTTATLASRPACPGGLLQMTVVWNELIIAGAGMCVRLDASKQVLNIDCILFTVLSTLMYMFTSTPSLKITLPVVLNEFCPLRRNSRTLTSCVISNSTFVNLRFALVHVTHG